MIRGAGVSDFMSSMLAAHLESIPQSQKYTSLGSTLLIRNHTPVTDIQLVRQHAAHLNAEIQNIIRDNLNIEIK